MSSYPKDTDPRWRVGPDYVERRIAGFHAVVYLEGGFHAVVYLEGVSKEFWVRLTRGRYEFNAKGFKSLSHAKGVAWLAAHRLRVMPETKKMKAILKAAL
jgi:hypothetical protein